ncbi:YlxR family protein [Pseudanabaena biceps]|nr:YlxR family protein [Pseudanabaena biceps]
MPLKLYRRCVSCQCVAQRDNFWRVVRVPIAQNTAANLLMDKAKVPDSNATRGFQIQLDCGIGRSAYLCQSLSCLQIAQKKNRLGRSLRTPIPPEIFEILKSRLQLTENIAVASQVRT